MESSASATRSGTFTDGKKSKKSLAHVKSPVIDALIHQRFVFTNRADAVEKIRQIEQRFVRSSLAESVTPETTVVWIRGFQLTGEEEKSGCIGNYAVVQADQTPDGKYTLIARKLPVEPARHPVRKRRKGKHPDWGYWVLRRVQKNWRYGSIDEAYGDLMKLAEDFPEVSIPSQNKLYTIIYRKTTDGSLPLFRVILEVEALPQGGFTITCKENTFKRENKPEKKSEEPAAESQEAPGRFASMVTVKRNRRKNIADLVGKSSDKGGDSGAGNSDA